MLQSGIMGLPRGLMEGRGTGPRSWNEREGAQVQMMGGSFPKKFILKSCMMKMVLSFKIVTKWEQPTSSKEIFHIYYCKFS